MALVVAAALLIPIFLFHVDANVRREVRTFSATDVVANSLTSGWASPAAAVGNIETISCDRSRYSSVPLTAEMIWRSMAAAGEAWTWRGFRRKLQLGEPITALILGGSVEVYSSWPARFCEWLGTQARGSTCVNGAAAKKGSMWLYQHLDHSGADGRNIGELRPDLVLLATATTPWGLNSTTEENLEQAWLDMSQEAFWTEKLVRAILSLPSRPILVAVEWFTFAPSVATSPHFITNEDEHLKVHQYYGVPVCSVRDAVWPHLSGVSPGSLDQQFQAREKPTVEVADFFADSAQPSGLGSNLSSDLISAFLCVGAKRSSSTTEEDEVLPVSTQQPVLMTPEATRRLENGHRPTQADLGDMRNKAWPASGPVQEPVNFKASSGSPSPDSSSGSSADDALVADAVGVEDILGGTGYPDDGTFVDDRKEVPAPQLPPLPPTPEVVIALVSEFAATDNHDATSRRRHRASSAAARRRSSTKSSEARRRSASAVAAVHSSTAKRSAAHSSVRHSFSRSASHSHGSSHSSHSSSHSSQSSHHTNSSRSSSRRTSGSSARHHSPTSSTADLASDSDSGSGIVHDVPSSPNSTAANTSARSTSSHSSTGPSQRASATVGVPIHALAAAGEKRLRAASREQYPPYVPGGNDACKPLNVTAGVADTGMRARAASSPGEARFWFRLQQRLLHSEEEGFGQRGSISSFTVLFVGGGPVLPAAAFREAFCNWLRTLTPRDVRCIDGVHEMHGSRWQFENLAHHSGNANVSIHELRPDVIIMDSSINPWRAQGSDDLETTKLDTSEEAFWTENLVRSVLLMEFRPVLLYWEWATFDTTLSTAPSFFTNEDAHLHVLKYYGIPACSGRDALWPQLSRQDADGTVLMKYRVGPPIAFDDMFTDPATPTAFGLGLAADLLSDFVCHGLHRASSLREEDLVLDALLPPTLMTPETMERLHLGQRATATDKDMLQEAYGFSAVLAAQGSVGNEMDLIRAPSSLVQPALGGESSAQDAQRSLGERLKQAEQVGSDLWRTAVSRVLRTLKGNSTASPFGRA